MLECGSPVVAFFNGPKGSAATGGAPAKTGLALARAWDVRLGNQMQRGARAKGRRKANGIKNTTTTGYAKANRPLG